jgi:sRNA-binding regulator protein Hfq
MLENVEKTMKEDMQKQERKPARYNTPYGYGVLDNFGAQLVGRLLTFELVNNKMVTGKLKGYGQFDIMVTDSRTGQDNIVMKHAIVSVQGDLSVKLSK